tara:strand:- start:194 stop:436 length:243 start_codon:yes stop_codon:yes gene_type:complete
MLQPERFDSITIAPSLDLSKCWLQFKVQKEVLYSFMFESLEECISSFGSVMKHQGVYNKEELDRLSAQFESRKKRGLKRE